jgi:hypothetical protein
MKIDELFLIGSADSVRASRLRRASEAQEIAPARLYVHDPLTQTSGSRARVNPSRDRQNEMTSHDYGATRKIFELAETQWRPQM